MMWLGIIDIAIMLQAEVNIIHDRKEILKTCVPMTKMIAEDKCVGTVTNTMKWLLKYQSIQIAINKWQHNLPVKFTENLAMKPSLGDMSFFKSSSKKNW